MRSSINKLMMTLNPAVLVLQLSSRTTSRIRSISRTIAARQSLLASFGFPRLQPFHKLLSPRHGLRCALGLQLELPLLSLRLLLASDDVAANRLLPHHHHGLTLLPLLHLLLHLHALLHPLHSASCSTTAAAARTAHSHSATHASAAHPHSAAHASASHSHSSATTSPAATPSLRVSRVGHHQTERRPDGNRREQQSSFAGKSEGCRICESLHRKSFPGWWFSLRCRQ
jgi:hypothetical protein